jgi:hypothetical protein
MGFEDLVMILGGLNNTLLFGFLVILVSVVVLFILPQLEECKRIKKNYFTKIDEMNDLLAKVAVLLKERPCLCEREAEHQALKDELRKILKEENFLSD